MRRMYNALLRSLDTEVIPACRRYGRDVVVYNTTGGGIFSGKYQSTAVPNSGRFSNSLGAGWSFYRQRYFKESTFKALQLIEPVAAKHNLTLIETALRRCIHHSALSVVDGNDGLILGASSLKQLQNNLQHCKRGPLPDEVVEALDEAWLLTKADVTNYWHLDLKYTYDTKAALFHA